jgi:hypothetical protein
MKHPLDRARTLTRAGISGVIGMKKGDLPHRASLDLQKRPRNQGGSRRAAEFLRIARQQSAGLREV